MCYWCKARRGEMEPGHEVWHEAPEPGWKLAPDSLKGQRVFVVWRGAYPFNVFTSFGAALHWAAAVGIALHAHC
jgi:hypothetical protein